MRKLLGSFFPVTRLGLLLWAWRNRASVLDWAAFALRVVQAAVAGDGVDDAKAEFRLRANLARDRRTRGALVAVSVERGVASLTGRVTPDVHAAVQDMAVATPGIDRIDDRITHSNGRGLLRRRARTAA